MIHTAPAGRQLTACVMAVPPEELSPRRPPCARVGEHAMLNKALFLAVTLLVLVCVGLIVAMQVGECLVLYDSLKDVVTF